MLGSQHQSPSIFSKTRVLSNWLQPPEVVTANDSSSRLSVQIQGDERSYKHDNMGQPTSQDQFMRELSKVRLDVRHSRRRLDASQQLNQSKSSESLSNQNRLQFIQQKFKEKDELLVLQQNIIQNLKRDIRHRDRIIQTIREAPQEMEGIGTNRNFSKQEDGMLRRMQEQSPNSHRKSKVETDKPHPKETDGTPVPKHRQMLSFVSEVEQYPEYNVRIFPSEEEIAASQYVNIGNRANPPDQLDLKTMTNGIATTTELKERLSALTKQHQASRLQHRSKQNKLRHQLEKKTEEYEKMALRNQITERELAAVKSELQKVKYALDDTAKLLEIEKNRSGGIEKRTKEFEAVEKTLRTALNARDNQIRQLGHEVNQLKLAARVESQRPAAGTVIHHDAALKKQLQSIKVQLISKDLEVKDLQRFCRRLQDDLATAKSRLDESLQKQTLNSTSSYLRIEELDRSRSKSRETQKHHPAIKPPVKPKRPAKPPKQRLTTPTLQRSKSITYYPTLKWQRVVD